MKRRDDRDEEVKPIARQIEQLARAPQYVPRGYRIGDYGNHTERRSERDVVIIDSQAPRACYNTGRWGVDWSGLRYVSSVNVVLIWDISVTFGCISPAGYNV